jgi:hypothetical protein
MNKPFLVGLVALGFASISCPMALANCDAHALAINSAMNNAKGIRQTDQQAFVDGDVKTVIFDWRSPSEFRYTIVEAGGFVGEVVVMQMKSWIKFSNGKYELMSSTVSRDVSEGKKVEYPFVIHPEKYKISCKVFETAGVATSELFMWTEKQKSFVDQIELWADPKTHFIQKRYMVHNSVAKVDDNATNSIFTPLERVVIQPPK